jgi:Domain of unknown function (DUF1918)
MDASVGDVIEVSSRKVGTPPRRGTVTEVLDAQRPELRVRWEDGRETVLYPSAGVAKIVGRAN